MESTGDGQLLEVMLLSRSRRKAVCLVRRKMTVEEAVTAARTIACGRTFVQAAAATRVAWSEQHGRT